MDATNDEVTLFKCRKCRQVVFSTTHLSVARCSANGASVLCDDSDDLRLTAATTGYFRNSLPYVMYYADCLCCLQPFCHAKFDVPYAN